MKTLVTIVVSLLVGVLIGWQGERRRGEKERAQIVQQMVEGTESSDRERALRALLAIHLIESSNGQKAVELLSAPVAHYYTIYSEPGTKEEHRAETRALIDQLAKTNQAVAARIAEHAANLRTQKP